MRRELANAIVSDSPNKMVALYRKGWVFEQEMLKADAARVQAEFDVLTKRYPLYEDFDLLGTRHFVPYSEAVESCEEDAVAERYFDISKFMFLKNINAKSTRPIFSESEDAIVPGIAPRIVRSQLPVPKCQSSGRDEASLIRRS